LTSPEGFLIAIDSPPLSPDLAAIYQIASGKAQASLGLNVRISPLIPQMLPLGHNNFAFMLK
jgi:hypothetical protein